MDLSAQPGAESTARRLAAHCVAAVPRATAARERVTFELQEPRVVGARHDGNAGPNDPINALPAAFSHDQVTRLTMQVLAAGGFTRGLMTAFFWG